MRYLVIRHTVRGFNTVYTDPVSGKEVSLPYLPFLAPGEDASGYGLTLAAKLGLYLQKRWHLQLEEIYAHELERTLQTAISLALAIGHRKLLTGKVLFAEKGPQDKDKISAMKKKLQELEPIFDHLNEVAKEKYPDLPKETEISETGYVSGRAQALRQLGTGLTLSYFTGTRILSVPKVKEIARAPGLVKKILYPTRGTLLQRVSQQFAYIKKKIETSTKDNIMVAHDTDLFCQLDLLGLPHKFASYKEPFIPPLGGLLYDVDHRRRRYVRIYTISVNLETREFKELLLHEYKYVEFMTLLENNIRKEYFEALDTKELIL